MVLLEKNKNIGEGRQAGAGAGAGKKGLRGGVVGVHGYVLGDAKISYFLHHIAYVSICIYQSVNGDAFKIL